MFTIALEWLWHDLRVLFIQYYFFESASCDHVRYHIVFKVKTII